MSPRMRPITNLYFKWIHGTKLQGVLDDVDVARCLVDADLIRMDTNLSGAPRYYELPSLFEKSQDEIMGMLENYAAKHSPFYKGDV